MMYHYRAYGLTIASELPLPELVADSVPASNAIGTGVGRGIETGRHMAVCPDVMVQLAPILAQKPAHAVGTEKAWATQREVMMEFEESGRFLIRHGNEIVVEPAAGAEDIAIRLFLLGPALGALLHQRGFLVLHASAIAIDGVAVAFLAEKGTGKSTLAAAFNASGHMLVADDIVPVELEAPGAPLAYPGFPQLKLFPESADQLGGRSDELPRLLPNYDKRARRLDSPFPDKPLPLRRLYVLTDGDAHRISPLPVQQAFMSLVEHSFLLPLLRATSTDASHFRQVARLFGMLPVRSLQRRRSLAALPEVVRMVVTDLNV